MTYYSRIFTRTTLIIACTLSATVVAHEEVGITLDALPPGVLDAVHRSHAGLVVKSAESVRDSNSQYFEIEGELDGREVELQLSPDGQIIGTGDD